MAHTATSLTKRRTQEQSDDMENDSTLQMRLSAELKASIDELRKAEPDLPSRSEMLRRLIERALAGLKKGRK